jgi:hypothetical protein
MLTLFFLDSRSAEMVSHCFQGLWTVACVSEEFGKVFCSVDSKFMSAPIGKESVLKKPIF